jgi:hypothetical protein
MDMGNRGGYQGLTREIKNRTLLLTTDFDRRDNALNKLTIKIRGIISL